MHTQNNAKAVTDDSNSIIQQLQFYLEGQLKDTNLAQELVEVIQTEVLTWIAPSSDLNNVSAIIAYSFGYRRLDNGNIIPGPMNENLAKIVVDLYQRTGCSVYAQWEIAEAIGEQISHEMLHAINPDIDRKDATIKYLSTMGVTLKVREYIKDPKSLGKVIIVAYRDHAPRCVRIARKLGFEAFVPQNVELPDEYDPASGQAWTRDRRAYIIHDILARLATYRAEIIGTASPSDQLD